MDISVLTTTNDIEQLRTLALALVQNVVAENAERKRELQSKDVALQEKEHRIRLLEEALMLARQHRFGRKCEALSGLQRLLFEEDTDADIAAAENQLENLLPAGPSDEVGKRSIPVRKPLPEHLPALIKS